MKCYSEAGGEQLLTEGKKNNCIWGKEGRTKAQESLGLLVDLNTKINNIHNYCAIPAQEFLKSRGASSPRKNNWGLIIFCARQVWYGLIPGREIKEIVKG